MGTQFPTLEQVSSLSAGSVSPSTGLEGKSKTPTFPTLAQIEQGPQTDVKSGFYGGAGTGLNPDKFPFQLVTNSDNEEMRAQNQSVGQQALFGAGRFVGTTATKFLEGFGYAGAAAEALFTNATMAEAVDNGLINLMSAAEEGIKENLPIYHTNKYKEGNILQQMGTFGFYADDIVDGAAFMVSALLGSKGINAALKGTKAFSALGKAYVQTTKAIKAGKAVSLLEPQAIKIAKVIEQMELGTMTAANTVIEAGFEMKDTKDQMLAEGYSVEDAEKAAMGTFKWNMGALMLSNYITNSMFFGKANPMAGRIKNVVDKKTGKLVSEVAPLTKGQIAGAVGKSIGTTTVSEGFYEENIQLAIQNYFAKPEAQRNPSELEGVIGGMVGNLGTKEGWKAITLGALIGLIPGGYGGFKEIKAEKKNEQNLHVILSSTINKISNDLEKQDLDMYEGEGENRKKVIDPETKAPLKDPVKVATYFANLMMTHQNFNLSVVAAENGNEIMLGRLEEERWASLALAHVFHPDGVERFKTEVDNFAKDRIAKAEKDGVAIDKDAIHKQAEKTKRNATYYKNVYDNIVSNYAGMYDFHTKGESSPVAMQANAMKDAAIHVQFMGAVDQMFWIDTIHELETERSKYTDPKVANMLISKDKVAAIDEQIKNVEEVLAESERVYKVVMDEALWQAKFDKSQKSIDEALGKNTTTVEDTKATPKDDKGENLQLFDSKGKGFEYKGTNAAGNHVVNDGKTDIILTNKQITERGIVLDDEAKTPLLGHLENLKKLNPDNEEPKTVTDVVDDKEIESEAAVEEAGLKARKESVVEELSNRNVTKVTGAETDEESIKQSVTTSVAQEYADPELLGGNLAAAFASGVATQEGIDVVYNNEVGVMFIDQEENEVVFKSNETGKEVIIGKTTDDDLFSGELSLLDLGIIPMVHTIFNIEVLDSGYQVIVQGRTYEIEREDPTSTIEVDEKGIPVAITLKDINGVPMRFTNQTLVIELAYTMELISEARSVVEDSYLNDLDADFVVVNDPRSTENDVIKYYVYKNADGTYSVIKPTLSGNKKNAINLSFVSVTNEKFKSTIMDAYFRDINAIISKIVEEKLALGPRATEEDLNNLQKRLKDEVKEFIRNSRSALEKDIIGAPGPSEVLAAEDEKKSKDEKKKSTGTDARPATGKQSGEEAEIVKEKAAEIVKGEKKNKETATKKAKKTKKESSAVDPGDMEPTNSVWDKKVADAEEAGQGILHSSTAVAYVAEENSAVDILFSNPETNLDDYHLEAEVADKYTTEDLIKPVVLDRYGNDNLDSLVDTIPIRLVLVDKNGKRMPFEGMFLHRSDFYNILIPASIKKLEDIDPALYAKTKEAHILKEKIATREFRRKVLAELLAGKTVTFGGLRTGKGILNQTPGVNRKISELKDDNGKIARTDANGTMYDGKGVIVQGTGGVGNVFWATTKTVTGEEFPIKLNVAKISERVANIILNAYDIAAQKKNVGYATLYESKEVEGELTVGELLKLLVLEGPITDYTSERKPAGNLPTSHLVDKQLWMDTVTGILHFGRAHELNMRKEVTPAQRKIFTDWLTSTKNYSVPFSTSKHSDQGVGSTLAKSFRIGDITGRSGETYESFLINNGMVLTDAILDPVTGRLFSKPAIIFDAPSWAKEEDPIPEPVKVEPVVKEPAKKKTTTKKDVDLLEAVDKQSGEKLTETSANKYFKANQEALEKGIAVFKRIGYSETNQVIPDDESIELEEVGFNNLSTEVRNLVLKGKYDAARAKMPRTYEQEVAAGLIGTKNTGVTKVSKAEDYSALPVGTFLYKESIVQNADEGVEGETRKVTVFGEIIEKDGQKVFIVTTTSKTFADDVAPYHMMDVTNPEIGKLAQAALITKSAKLLASTTDPRVTESAPIKKTEKAEDFDEEIHGDFFRIRKGTENYTVGDVEKATKWLRKKFGNSLTVKQEEELIEVALRAGNAQAFGTFNKDAITLSKRLELGTEYHEAYHRVELMFLSPEQRKAIHDEARVRYGLRKATDDEIKEVLAEEYRKFEIARGKNKLHPLDMSGMRASSKGSKILQFFQDLWDFIRTLFTGQLHISNLDINNLFRVINKSNGVFGRLQVARPNVASVAEIGETTFNKIVKGKDLKYITTTEVLNTVVKNLVYETIMGSGVFTTKDVNKLDYRVAEAVVIKRAEDYAKKAKEMLAAGRQADHDILMGRAGLYNEIVDNYDTFLELMRDNFETLGVRTRLPEDKAKDEADNAGFNFERWGHAGFELDGKDTAGTAIKFIIATLPATKTLDPATGMKQFVDFDDMWDSLQSEMYMYDTVEEMLNVLKEKIAVPYQFLVSRLEKDRLSDKYDTLRTQFLIAMRKNRYSYDHGLINRKGNHISVDITDAETQRAGFTQSVIWGQNFFMSDMFKDGKPVVSKLTSINVDYLKLLNAVKSAYKANPTGIPNIEELITDLMDLFNRVSVDLNREVIDTILNKYDSNNKSKALYDFVVDSVKSKMPSVFGPRGAFISLATQGKLVDRRGGERQLQNIFRNESLFNDIVAPAYLEVMGGSIQNTILGPGGNTYQLVSENSYLTDVVRELTNMMNQDTYNHLKNTDYNSYSYLLSQMIDPKVRAGMGVGVFSAFSMKKAKDKGRGFDEITQVENILLQMSLFRAGRIPLPQLGDRSHLYMIRGLKPIDFQYTYDPKTGQVLIPNDVFQIFHGYALDEYKRIERVKKEIKTALANDKEYTLLKNYHFKLNERGERDYTKGNGLFYQHFTDFNGQNVTKSEIPELVRQTINARIKDGVKEFAKQGIVTLTSEGKLGNNLMMDEEMLKQIATKRFGDPTRIRLAMENEIANYTLNSIMATIESEKLLFMDPAYYANLEDKIKRYTAIASTGATGRVRIDPKLFPGERLLHDSDTFKTLVLATQLYDAETIRTELEEKFTAIYETQGLTNAAAKAKAKRKLKAYGKVDATDGQAYITPEMFRAIHIRMGEWTDDKQAGYDLLNKENLTAEEQNVLDGLFMQPLKYMYFGPNITPGTMAPVFYKMSLATLTPQLVKGTQLQSLYDRMTDVNDPADMVPFDSAVKVGVKEPHKYYATEGKKVLTDVVDTPSLTAAMTESLQFKYLRKQVVTDPHGEVRSVVKTQVRKLILSNIVDSQLYPVGGQKITGKQLKEEYANLVGELSDRGKAKLLDELGLDETTFMETVPGKMRNELMKKARSASMSESLIEALSKQADGENFEYDSLPDRKWIQSTLISMMGKRTIDLELPGTSLIQMSNFGLRKANKDDSLQLIDEQGYMECKVSIEAFRDVIPNYKNLTYEERTKYASLMIKGVGYRVPTQGLNSIVPLKIVGFLPPTSTATISLPSEFTSLTGSDFDIDKLFLIRHNYETVEGKPQKIEYKEGEYNTTKAIENRLVDMYFGVLRSADHVLENWIPLDASTDVIKGISEQVRELEGYAKDMPSLASASFIYQSQVKNSYMGGDKGIGPYARANVHHILGQIAGIHLNRDLGVGHTVEYQGRTVTDLSQIRGIDGELIQDWLSALISAHVDIAKDPYIFALNINAATYNIAELLIRAGVGSDTFWFMSQPILKEYAAKHMDAQGKVRADWSETMSSIRKLYEGKMKAATGWYEGIESTGTVWDKERLEGDIDVESIKDASYYARQLQVLKEFDDLRTTGHALFEAVSATQIDTEKYGNSLSSIRNFEKLLEKVLRDNVIVNMDKVFELTYMGKLRENSTLLAQSIFKDSDIMSSESIIALHEQIMSELGMRYSVTNKARDISDDVSDEIYSNIVGMFMVNQLGMSSGELKNMMFDLGNMAYRLNALKNDPKYVNNSLIKLLAPNMTFTEDPDFVITFGATDSKTKWAKDRITEGWSELLTDNNPVVSEFAKDLVKYSFYTSGFKRTLYSTFNFIPPAYLKEIGFSSFIRNIRVGLNDPNNASLAASLHDDVYRHMWGDDNIVPFISSGDISNRRNPFGWEPKYAMMLQIKKGATANLFLGMNKDYQYVFKPFIKTETNNVARLYKYIGYRMLEDGSLSPVYAIDSPRGYYSAGKVVKENGLDTTIFEDNVTEPVTQEMIDSTNGVVAESIGKDGKPSWDYTNFTPVATENLQLEIFAEDMDNLDQLLNSEPISTTHEFTWARKADNGYEVSTRGDSRFSAFNAIMGDGRSIEEHYQVDIKGYKSVKEGKGKPPLNINRVDEITGIPYVMDKEQSWQQYLTLWNVWAYTHPDLIRDLMIKAEGKVLTDMFANTEINQARALAEIINGGRNKYENPESWPVFADGRTTTTEDVYPFLADADQTGVVFSTESPEMQAAVEAAGITDWAVDKVSAKVKKELQDKYAHCK
jgi:hypothetical protein